MVVESTVQAIDVVVEEMQSVLGVACPCVRVPQAQMFVLRPAHQTPSDTHQRRN